MFARSLTEGRKYAFRYVSRTKEKGIGTDEKQTPLFQQLKRSSSFSSLAKPDVNILEGETAAQAVAHSLAGKLAALQDAGPACPARTARPASLAHPMLTREVATITEVCSGGELPEVEIISLLHENIPKYKLRADTLTQFSGYENQDWFIPSPALKIDDVDLKLSPDQIRETLNYFILCSNRVSQMTKTYNDIEAVTRLLEEKEKDLELTARIGKELLTHNNKLEASVNSLEAELKAAKDEITQLAHDVIKKTELIQVLTNEVDDSGVDHGVVRGAVSLEVMRRRIGGLEDENRSLRAQADRLMCDTDAVEEREARLVRDVSAQLASASMEVYGMGDELARTKEEYQMQKDLLDSTTARLQATEQKLHQVTVEHEQAIALLEITRDNQNSLAAELVEFKERYAEVLALLREAQEQARAARTRPTPLASLGRPAPSLASRSLAGSLMPHVAMAAGLHQHDSLQSELESSLYSDLSMDSGIGGREQPFKKVFETVKCATRSTAQGLEKAGRGATCGTTGSTAGPVPSAWSGGGVGGWAGSQAAWPGPSSGPRMSICSSSDSAMDNNSVTSSYGDQDREDIYPGGPNIGVPGVPGAADLEAALRKLSPSEIMARRAKLSSGQHYNPYDYDGGRSSPVSSLPFGLRTPDSIMSTGMVSGSGRTGASWRLPDRLQIVKPMEGSHTLHQWAQLATPTMSGLLEDRPGIQLRGGRGAGDLGVQMYSLNDVEEDDDYPRKRFDNSSAFTYTYTNSMVMHPDDGSMAGSMAGSRMGSMAGSLAGSEAGSLWGSARGSAAPSACSTRPHSPTQTPRASLSRRNSTCTYSTNMGLANILNERGIKAVTPSCSATPTAVWSPTATPCNSPQLGSPSSSPPNSPSAERVHSSNPLPPLSSLISSGAEILRRTFSPHPVQAKRSTLSQQERLALGNLHILDQVERIGLDGVGTMGTSPLALQATGTLFSRRGQQSPMAQLTCLKHALHQGGMQRVLSDVVEHAAETVAVAGVLGVPAQPGGGVLRAQLERSKRRPRPRQDLGTVTTTRPDLGSVNKPEKQTAQPFSTLGTLSSLLFGRKGGLL